MGAVEGLENEIQRLRHANFVAKLFREQPANHEEKDEIIIIRGGRGRKINVAMG